LRHTVQKYSEKCYSVNDVQIVAQNTGRATEGRLHHKALPSIHFEDAVNVANRTESSLGRYDMMLKSPGNRRMKRRQKW
jgi:hypothetical protein